MNNKIEYLLSMNNEELTEEIDRINLYDLIFKEDNHYNFVWLVQGLKDDKILILLNDKIISYLVNDKRKIDKLNAIMTCNNRYAELFLGNEEILKIIIDNIDHLGIYFDSLGYDFGQKLFEYTLKNIDYISSIHYLSDKVQKQIFASEENVYKLYGLEIGNEFLSCLSKSGIEELLKYPKYQEIFTNTRIDIINVMIEKGIVVPDNLIKKDLINKYVNITDINKYRNYMVNLNKNNNYIKDIVETKKKRKYIEDISGIDLDLGLLSFYKIIYEKMMNDEEYLSLLRDETSLSFKLRDANNDPNKILKILQDASEKKMLEITIDMFYEDITYNVLKNFETMINYYYTIGDSIIPKERIERYEKFINYEELTVAERKKIFLELCDNKNHVEELYDDFRVARDHCYSKIKDKCLDVNNINKNKELTDEYGIPVYKLDGENFFAMVHHSTYNRYNRNWDEDYFLWQDPKETISLSLIGEKNISTFRDGNAFIIFGFNNFDSNRIMHMYETDSYTSHQYGTDRVQRLFNPNDFLNETKGYNEILMKDKNYDGMKTIRPDYIICYDSIKSGDILCAKKMNLPIVVINTDKYQYSGFMIDNNGDNYVDNYSASYIEDYRKDNRKRR